MSKEYDIEDDDVEFNEALQQRRHNELLDAFKKLIGAIGQDNGVSSAIQSNNSLILDFTKKLTELKFEVPKIESPKVTVNTNNDAIAKSISELAQGISDNQKQTNDLLQTLIEARGKDIEMTVKERNVIRQINK